MNIKKIIAGLTAAVCSAGIVSYVPQLNVQTFAETAVWNDFESNYEGWYGSSETTEFFAIDNVGFENSRGMKVSGRTSASEGAVSSKGFYLEGGTEYNYSMQVYSETDETFRLSLLVIDEVTGKETVKEIASKKVKGGKWTKLSADYTAPENSYEFRLTLTTDSTNDFTFDNVKITSEKSSQSVYAAQTDIGLKDVYGKYFRVGNILNGGTVRNSTITASFLKDYNSVECENETKPDATMVQSQCSGTNIAVSINNAASIMDFCVKNNLPMRGHTLVWHSQTPLWFFKEGYNASGAWASKSTMDARMESYMKNLFALIKQQYPDLDLYAYDVANECISDDSNRTANHGGTRVPGENKNGESPWVQVYGDNSFVEKAFTLARKYAPEGCALYYNDYNEYWDHKRDAIYNMCKSLYNKGLLDGIGMQSHINANYDGFSGVANYTTALKKYASIGCDVQITELDITRENGTYSDAQQAEKYKAIFKAAMDINTGSYPGKVTAVCVWGPNDANTWIKTENAPLLYDTNHKPKTAYNELMKMVPESDWVIGGYEGGPTVIEPNKYGWYFQDGFEGDQCGWTARGGKVAVSSDKAGIGSKSLLVSDRTKAWNGAQKNLNTAAFKPGSSYSFSVNVYSPTAQKFCLTLQYEGSNGTVYDNIDTVEVAANTWTQLADKNFKIPSDAKSPVLVVETTGDTLGSFYIDEAIGALADTTIVAIDVASPSLGGSTTEPGGTVDTSEGDAIFKNVTALKSYKKDGENNVLWTQRFGADPGFMVYKDRLYVYTTNDAFEYNSQNKIQTNTYDVQTINCFSTADMVNWTDHGAIPVAGRNNGVGAAKWASYSWAPDAAWKTINGKDKFFLYFADSAGGIGVLSADSPTGPWVDPIGKALINKSTPGYGDVEWLFDPAVLVDDDGTGYLYVGGGVPSGKAADPGTARAVKLGADMTSLSGSPVVMNPPYLFEDSSIIKEGNTYYYTYCTNWQTGGNNMGIKNAQIGVMTATNPLGPFTYKGIAFGNPAEYGLDGGGNNHHSFVKFKDKFYVIYHSRNLSRAMGIQAMNPDGTTDLGGNYRSPHVDEATLSNGMFKATGSMKGVSQVQTVDPYTLNQAEMMSNQSTGIKVNGLGNTTVAADKGAWLKVSGLNFSKGAKTVTIKGSSSKGATIKICSSLSGAALGYAKLGSSMANVEVPVSIGTGTKDIYFVCSDSAVIDSWQFGTEGSSETPSETYATFADGTAVKIQNQNSSLYLRVDGNEATRGNVMQDAYDESEAMWRLYNAGDGYYYVMSALYDGATLPLWVNTSSNDLAVNYKFADIDECKFKFVKNSDGSYVIKPKSSDTMALEIADGSKTNKANAQQGTASGKAYQNWIIESCGEVGIKMDTDVVYTFKNVNSSMVIDVEGGKFTDGTNAIQYTSNGKDNQKWTLEEANYGYYYIHPVGNKECYLTADNSANIFISKPSQPNSMMFFKFRKNIDGSYTITSRTGTGALADTKVVEVASASKTAGANVQIYAPNGESCQKWNLVTETTTTVVTTTTTTTKATTTKATTTKPTTTTTTQTITTTTTKATTTKATTTKVTTKATTTKATTTKVTTTKVTTTKATTTKATTTKVTTTKATTKATTTKATTTKVTTTKATTTKATTTKVTTTKITTTIVPTSPTLEIGTPSKMGDVNLDGEVAASDIVVLSKYMINSALFNLKNSTAAANADVTRDGVIGSSDTLMIIEYIVGVIKLL